MDTQKKELNELDINFIGTQNITPNSLFSLPVIPVWLSAAILVSSMIVLALLAGVQSGSQIAGTALAMCAGCQ